MVFTGDTIGKIDVAEGVCDTASKTVVVNCLCVDLTVLFDEVDVTDR